jgi:hypothetical protein
VNGEEGVSRTDTDAMAPWREGIKSEDGLNKVPLNRPQPAGKRTVHMNGIANAARFQHAAAIHRANSV